MKAETMSRTEAAHQFLTINGQRVVVLGEKDYVRLRQRADDWEPSMPEPDADGNYPAVEAARVSLARKIIRHRRRLGLTREELAKTAGIRVQTLDQAEDGQHTPMVATVEKIERALLKAEKHLHARQRS